MTFAQWKKKSLPVFKKKLLEAGFTPEAVEEFIEVQEEVMDMAYAMGRKEEQDGGGED